MLELQAEPPFINQELIIMNLEPTYAELINQYGGKPIWCSKLSDRAAHALLRSGYDLSMTKNATLEELALLPNVGPSVAAEIKKKVK